MIQAAWSELIWLGYCQRVYMYSLFGRSSVKLARIKAIESWNGISGAGALFTCHRIDNCADCEEMAVSSQFMVYYA